MKNLLTRNSKIAKMSGAYTVNWTLPAIKTCPQAGLCKTGCYASQGAYKWSPSVKAHERNFELTKQDDFVQLISAELTRRKKIKRVRIHDAGDFYNESYMGKWLMIAARHPDIEFYAYTKMVKMFKIFERLPRNFIVIYSFGGRQDSLIDVTKDRHSRVFDSLAELKSARYADSSKDDAIATGLNPRIGLVYHGAKSKAWSV